MTEYHNVILNLRDSSFDMTCESCNTNWQGVERMFDDHKKISKEPMIIVVDHRKNQS